jgi:hypothetical protein
MMNDRINILAEQAGFYVSESRLEILAPDSTTDNVTDALREFAELIVAECLGIVDDAERGGSNDIWDNAVKFIRRDLQEHFGVEE